VLLEVIAGVAISGIEIGEAAFLIVFTVYVPFMVTVKLFAYRSSAVVGTAPLSQIAGLLKFPVATDFFH